MTDTQYEKETFEGSIEKQWGRNFDVPVSYIGEFNKILSNEAIPAAEMPSDEDILDLVNNKRKANARQKAMSDALATAAKAFERDNPGKDNPYVRPTLENSDDLRVKNMVDAMVSQKKADGTALYATRQDAEKLARQILGLA